MRAARPGVRESDVAAAVQQIALAEDRAQSYNPIVSVRGEVLHNNTYDNVLEPGQMLLNDSGAESPRFYASDITRCCPIGGRFTPEQKGVYDAVLAAQHAAIQAIRPGVRFKDIHLAACRVMVEGLCEVGLMSGDPAEAVTAGAHALFFPHGLGHMLGLDVHDMEDLGDVVGYPEGAPRSTQFGLNFLRLSRELEPGFVFTIEPGCYFIPALIDRWRELRLHREFIRYERLESFRNFGGIRIEDDLLCTEDGYRILGEPIPKSPEEVEAAMAS
jgi:Xaa-Pro aminopeptidase